MTATGPSTNQHWFRIGYTSRAAAGLPPIIQAERIVRYRDNNETWLVALWDAVDATSDPVSNCILRLPATHVASVSQHESLEAAASQSLQPQDIDRPEPGRRA